MITSIATKVFSLIFGAVAAYCLYNVFLHPLRSHRGPRSWACTRIPWMWHNVKGDLAQKLVELHEAYGPVVRIAPDELSYAKASAWRDIYGERSGTEMAKALDGRGIAPTHYDGDHSILQAPTPETHRRLRRLLQPAFTESAMLNEEPLIRKNVNNLMRILRTHARNGSAPVDLTRLFVEAVFDVLGDLGFGESFNTLDGGAEGQAIVNTGLKAAKAVVFLRVAFFYRMEKLMKFITPPSVARSRQQLISLTTQRLEARLKKPATARPDFFSFVLAGSEKNNSGSDQLSLHELVLMAVVFIGAGTLTTAFSAVAAIYLLCNNEIAYLRLREELDDAFSNQEDITLSSTRQLKFLQAVIKETLRIYPPVPGTLPRVVPVGGAFVDGDWIPGGTAVGVHPLSTVRSEHNFHDAGSFRPERWLDPRPEEFKKDVREACQPFSFGPRDCVGKTLARAELSLFLASLVYNFDFKLNDDSDAWMDNQRSLLAWEAPPLMVRLCERVRV